jgi:hypothetical protein
MGPVFVGDELLGLLVPADDRAPRVVGPPETSRICSIRQTKAASWSGGMHHIRSRHGFSSLLSGRVGPVSHETVPTTSNSTSRSASSRSDHRASPLSSSAIGSWSSVRVRGRRRLPAFGPWEAR